MKNVLDESCRENRNTHFMSNNFFFPFSKIVPFMRYIGKTFAVRSRPQMTICRIRIACLIPRATNSRSGCVLHIDFPLQQWLHERSSLLHSPYIALLV